MHAEACSLCPHLLCNVCSRLFDLYKAHEQLWCAVYKSLLAFFPAPTKGPCMHVANNYKIIECVLRTYVFQLWPVRDLRASDLREYKKGQAALMWPGGGGGPS